MGRRLAVVGIAAAMSFTALTLVWRFVDDSWLSFELPSTSLLDEPFGIFAWVQLIVFAMIVAAALGPVVWWVTRRRGAMAWILGALPFSVCFFTATLYLPFFGGLSRRVDRVAGTVLEPVPSMQALALIVFVTFTLTVSFLAVTLLRRTPQITRRAAFTAAVVLATLHAHLLWILLVFPIERRWTPAVWHSVDMLVPFRPCRGAIVWAVEKSYARPVVRIDDVWLHFADPRRSGERAWAVSGPGEWSGGYRWLVRAEAERLRMRRDDPALVECDSRPRTEIVEPAEWHRLGIE